MNNIDDDYSRSGANYALEQGRRIASRLGRRVVRGLRKHGRTIARSGARMAANAVKKLGAIIGKMLLVLGPIGLIVLAVIIVFLLLFTMLLEERGSTESNSLDPDVQNPSYVEDDSGITKAIAMTEPQAVIDAYYKYLSCSSYSKIFNGKVYRFNDPSQTEDFAGLRDYMEVERNYYLSDDFIRSLDEQLHQNEFYYPEQIIKPVFGQQLLLKDNYGNTGSFYTARFPVDTDTGAAMLGPDAEVKDFDKMLASESLPGTSGGGKTPHLIAKSQTPTESVNAQGEKVYTLKDRTNLAVQEGSSEPGLWDYGFGSVLQYQPEQKKKYIECSYDRVDVDLDYREKYLVSYQFDPSTGTMVPVYEWTEWKHGTVVPIEISSSENLSSIQEKCQDICDSKAIPGKTEWSYTLPRNIKAILDNSVAWDISVEPNAKTEARYASSYSGGERALKNNHIDMKIDNGWDMEIDKIQFKDSDLKASFGNNGGGLYPLKIAVTSHAATFSGNIHYTITTNSTSQPLEPNSKAVDDHREPVQTIHVAGGCVPLTAHRTGTYTTQAPQVEETGSPWGFGYLEQYASNYRGYIPEDIRNDRDFFLRTGLKADENSADKKKYKENLQFLKDLGLLRPYTGGGAFTMQQNAMGTVDISTANIPGSDLYILSHVIAAEAGPNKLDELMVGSVFVNRVYSSAFPNTFQEVLTQPNQYSTYPTAYNKATVTASDLASAVQVMSGQFTIPANVVGQSAKIQGTIYTMVDNPAGLNDHYYCTNGKQDISTVDRYGRPAPSPSQLPAMAAALSNSDPNSAASSALYQTTAFIGDELTAQLDTLRGLGKSGAVVISKSGASCSDLQTLVQNKATLNQTIKTIYLQIGKATSTEPGYEALKEVIRSKVPQANIITVDLVAQSYDEWMDTNYKQPSSNGESMDYEIYDPTGVPIRSPFNLYAITNFNVSEAINMQTRLKQPDAGFLETLKNIIGSVGDVITGFFDGISNIFDSSTESVCFRYASQYNDYDVKSVVYHSLSFANQCWFSTVESKAEDLLEKNDGLMFLFVGSNPVLGLSSSDTSNFQPTIGVGTSVTGMISPTASPCHTLVGFSKADPSIQVSTAIGTDVLAVADGQVVAVGNDVGDYRGRYVEMTTIQDGDSYRITLGFLGEVSVAPGPIKRGARIGLSGKNHDGSPSLYISVEKNGKAVDPSTIFYQLTYSNSPGLAGNLNNPDGSVNQAAITALEQQLTQYVTRGGGVYHKAPLNTLQYKQCTWWAFGRGLEFIQSKGIPVTVAQYTKTFRHNNGGDYAIANQTAGKQLFAQGSIPRPNSLVSYHSPTGAYGHVAYVEAVDSVTGEYYVSEAGGGTWWGGINKYKPGQRYHSPNYGWYDSGTFIYLDQPLNP